MTETISRFSFLEEATRIIEDKIVQLSAPALGLAEAKARHEDKGCYCKNCLKVAADNANNEVLWIMGMEDRVTKEQWELVKGYLFYVVPSKRGFKIIHGTDLEEERYNQWWENATPKGDNLGPFGRIP